MIEAAPFLNAFYADMLGRTDRYLVAQGVGSKDYAVAWQADLGRPLMAIHYDEARFDDGDYHARINVHGQGSDIAIDTGLRMALGILRSTFDHVDNVVALRGMTAIDPEEMTLTIDPTNLASDIHSPGLFIDQDCSPLRLDNIEVNGLRTTLATSSSVTALHYVVAMIQYEARKRVGQRFAAFEEDI